MKRTTLAVQAALLLSVGSLLHFSGCNEDRFQPPKWARDPGVDVTTRLRAAPPARLSKSTTRPSSRPASSRPSVPTKALRLEPVYAHSAGIIDIVVGPSGRFAISAGRDNLLIRWDLVKGLRLRTYPITTKPIRALTLSSDGRRFAVLEGQQDITLWSVTGKRLQQRRLDSPISHLRFAPLNNHLYALGQDGTLLQLQGSQLSTQRRTKACDGPGKGLSIDQREELLLIGCRQKLWMMPLLAQQPKGSTQTMPTPFTTFALHPQSTWLATGHNDATISLWKRKAGKLQFERVGRYFGHLRKITHLAWSRQGQGFYSASADRHVGEWQLGPKAAKLAYKMNHRSAITALVADPQGKGVLSGTQRGTLTIWRPKGRRLRQFSPPSHQGQALSFHPRRDLFVATAERGSVAGWDIQTGQRTIAMSVHPARVIHTEFALSGNHMLSVDAYNAAFWDFGNRRVIDVIRPPKGSTISAACLGRDWTQVFFGTPDQGVLLWTLSGPNLLYRHSKPRHVSAVAVSSRRHLAAAGTLHGEIFLYDIRKFRVKFQKAIVKAPIRAIRFSPNGKTILLLSRNSATLWSVPSGKRATARWELKRIKRYQHDTTLLSAAFSPDGQHVALGTSGSEVLLWKWQSSRPSTTLRGCLGHVRDLRFSPRRGLLGVACSDGGVHLWDTQTRKKLATYISLEKKHWLSVLPDMTHHRSVLAGRHFRLFSDDTPYSLESFGRRWFSPQRFKQTLRQVLPALRKGAKATPHINRNKR